MNEMHSIDICNSHAEIFTSPSLNRHCLSCCILGLCAVTLHECLQSVGFVPFICKPLIRTTTSHRTRSSNDHQWNLFLFLPMQLARLDRGRTTAATTISRLVRGFLVRRRLSRLTRAITALQRLFRVRRAVAQWARVRWAAGVIGRWMRRCLSRMVGGAVGRWRGGAQRPRSACRQCRFALSRAIIRARDVQERGERRGEEGGGKSSAMPPLLPMRYPPMPVVALLRRPLCVQRFVRQTAAATRIQAAWHAHRSRAAQCEVTRSAIIVQKWARGWLVRLHTGRAYERAALTIQRAWARYKVRVRRAQRGKKAEKGMAEGGGLERSASCDGRA